MLPDYERYSNIWQAVIQAQADDLHELASTAKKIPPCKVCQPLQGFGDLYQLAHSIDDWYQHIVAEWAESLQLIHSRAPVKRAERAMEKIDRSYNGDVSRILDLVRSTIKVKSVQQAKVALELVRTQARVLNAKNRYDLEYDGQATAGYRDLNLQLSFPELEGTLYDGFVFELQIILMSFYEVKSDEGHRRYVVNRNLRGD